LQQRVAHLEQFSLALIAAANEWNVLSIDHYRTWIDLELNQTQLMDGGFHPNEYGHRQIARTIFESCDMWDSISWVCRLFIPT
jgi:lysophospholipase L1-like esterase